MFHQKKLNAYWSLTVCFLTLLLPAPLSAQTEKPHKLTAREVIAEIQKHVGVPWQQQTVDTFKAGDPDTPVTGIATTMMATLDVLKKANAAGCNLIITHEPTYYDHLDKIDDLVTENDAVLAAKQSFIREHHLVVWRFHDHWHRRNPDGIQTGMIQALGWEKFQDVNNLHLFVLPETTLEQFSSQIKKRLGIRTMRVVGDPQLKFSKVGLLPGAPGFAAQRRMLQRDEVEVLVIGEAREWETVEYADDAVSEGKRKALVILGHIPSEQAGMIECARWLKTFISDVKIEFIPAAEPFWSPK